MQFERMAHMTKLSDELLTVQQVADTLGIAESSVWRPTRSNDLPQSVEVFGQTRWRKAEI